MRDLQIANINGKGYELGIQFSQLFTNTIKNDFTYFKELLKDENIRKNLEKVKEKLKIKYPDYLAETYGRADGFNINRDEYLLNICFETYSPRESCTDIAIKIDDTHIVSGHNEDLSENLDEIALVKYNTNDGYFYEFSTYNCPQGTTFGWNNKGIVYSVNTVRIKENNETGIPVWFILRDIVQCGSIEEVIEKINVKDCASAFSLNIIDSNKNKAYSIEKILDKFDILEIKEKYIHTNHIIHPNMNDNICLKTDSTLTRLDIGNKLLDKVNVKEASIKDVKNILQFNKSKNEYIYRKIGEDEYPTVATFLFNSKMKEIQIYSYYDGEFLKLNME